MEVGRGGTSVLLDEWQSVFFPHCRSGYYRQHVTKMAFLRQEGEKLAGGGREKSQATDISL